MGLDITAYKALTKVENPKLDSDGRPENYNEETSFYANPDFPGRMEGIEENTVYRYVDAHGFRAGSYGGYNGWRNELAKLAGYPVGAYREFGRAYESYAAGAWKASEGPFYELINFSDCEGTIGPVVAAKLAKDFAEFQAKADEHPEDYFRHKYNEWRKAFEMAADNGAVDFH